MPNIEIVGFVRGDGIEGKVRQLLHELAPKAVGDAVITRHDRDEGHECTCVAHGLQKPYVRVASTDNRDRGIAQLISEELRLDVEWLHLDGFFEGKH